MTEPSSPDPSASPAAPVMVYRIDDDDCLTFLSPEWVQAARTSGGDGFEPERLLGCRLWDFVTDPKVVAMYRSIITRVRNGHKATFSYRCDTVTRERLYLMHIRQVTRNEVEFFTVLQRESERAPVALLDALQPRDKLRCVKMCGICQRVELPVNYWVPIEVAAQVGAMLATEPLPQLEHALCPSCEANLRRYL